MSKRSVTSLLHMQIYLEAHKVKIVEIVLLQNKTQREDITKACQYGHVMEVVAMEFSAIGFTVRRLCV